MAHWFRNHSASISTRAGAADNFVTIFAPAVSALGLTEDRTTAPAHVSGGGGTLPARSGTIAWIDVSGQRFENVDASFATEYQGAYSDSYIMGSVGGQILGGFTLVFDYANRRIAFKLKDS